MRLAQDFSSRYPLVEGQGNFGNIDGDNAAAYRYTEARLTDFARLLLEGIDEDAVDWRDNYSGDTQEPVVLPAADAEPARQRRAGHRRRHGDLRAAAQCRRTARRRAVSDRPPRGDRRPAAQLRPRPRFPDRRRAGRRPRDHRRGLSHRPRRLSPARALDEGGDRPRRLGRRRHRNPLRRAEIAADRGAGRARQPEEGAAARRRARRIDGGRAHRAGAALARGRARSADGAAVQAQRAGDAHLRQHERAGRRHHAARRQPERGVAAMARPSPRGAAAPLAPPARRDRAPARTARRHDDRLPQSRRGDPHRPRGGRAEAGADRALHAQRQPGQLHPRHAAALAAPSRRDAVAQGADAISPRRRRRSRRCSAPSASNGR